MKSLKVQPNRAKTYVITISIPHLLLIISKQDAKNNWCSIEKLSNCKYAFTPRPLLSSGSCQAMNTAGKTERSKLARNVQYQSQGGVRCTRFNSLLP